MRPTDCHWQNELSPPIFQRRAGMNGGFEPCGPLLIEFRCLRTPANKASSLQQADQFGAREINRFRADFPPPPQKKAVVALSGNFHPRRPPPPPPPRIFVGSCCFSSLRRQPFFCIRNGCVKQIKGEPVLRQTGSSC